MQVTQTAFTVAEYCDQMDSGAITVNREYQRSAAVWPPAARSFLIDTILLGYPMPKICLYQKTDVKSRKTTKEIVDGQQRSKAILDFYHDDFRLSSTSSFHGKKYSQLEEPEQQKFLGYPVSTDIFVGATDPDIRQMFRRINSYTVPLNPQEKRHAVFQGAFKWFILKECEQYAQSLKEIGVFSESQLSRMSDAALFTDICFTMLEGIQHASEAKLNALYESRDLSFPEEEQLSRRISSAISQILGWTAIHRTSLMKSYSFYTLFLATSHVMSPARVLNDDYEQRRPVKLKADIVLANLGALAEAIDDPSREKRLSEFAEACSKATNRSTQRKVRFWWFCEALQPKLI